MGSKRAARTSGGRHQLGRQHRRASARCWVDSGAAVSVPAHARRYGVDRYTAYADLLAIGFRLTPEDDRWAERPPRNPKRRSSPMSDDELDWIWLGDQRMVVVGHTPGGAPYGWVAGDDPDDPARFPSAV
jgi:hypothetical protein